MAQDHYEDREYVLKGGIIRHLSTFKYANAGFWEAKGLHGDDEDALTKWSGSERFSVTNLGGRVVGLYQVTLAGASYYFAMANGKIVRVNGATITDLLTGQVAGYYDGETLNAIFFAASGTNPNKKILSTLVVQDVGIAAPVGACVAVVSASAGVLNGAYSYRYTYRNSITGHESDPSPVSAVVSPTNDQVDLSVIAAAVDTQVDRKVIYRTTTGGEGVWFRVAEIDNITTVYTDNIADDNLAEAVLEDSGVPPQAAYLEVYNGMMAYAGLLAPNQNRVAMSGVLRPEAADPDNVYDLEPDEKNIITGMKRFGSALAVYKRNRLFMGSGRAPDEMDFTPTRVKEGALGNGCIIDYNSAHWYLSGRGPFVFSGLKEDFIGRPIQDFYKTLDQSMMRNSSGVFYEPLNMLIWNVMEVGQSDFNTWLCYNTQTREWTIRDFASSVISLYLDTINNPRLWLGGVNGLTYTGDVGTGDDGASIAVRLVTRGICLKYKDKQPDLEQTYCFRHVEVLYDANGGTAPVTVQYALDKPDAPYTDMKNSATGASTFVPTTGNRARFDLAGYGRLLFLKFTVSSAEALKIRGLRIQGTPLGRR